MPSRAERSLAIRIRSTIWLLPAWFSPSSALRVAFHRARGVRIGKNVEIGYFVIIDNLYPEAVVIDDDVTISARSTLLAHDEARAYAQGAPELRGSVHVGRGAFVGVHCVILPGVTIGERAIVGAGSVVTRDVPPRTTAVGVPARVISE